MKSASIVKVTLLSLLLSTSLKISAADNPEVSIQAISESILKSDGYKFFTFEANKEEVYIIDITRNSTTTPLIQTDPTKTLIVAIQLGPNNSLLKVNAYYANGTTSISSNQWIGQTYSGSAWKSPIVVGTPFLQLTSQTENLALTVNKK